LRIGVRFATPVLAAGTIVDPKGRRVLGLRFDSAYLDLDGKVEVA